MFTLSLPKWACRTWPTSPLLKASFRIKTRMIEGRAGVETGFSEKGLALSARSEIMFWLADSVYGVLVMGG